jgi:hypothetical protein
VRRVIGVALTVALSIAVMASCGDRGSADASTLLTDRVAGIRIAVERGNVDRARTLLERLQNAVGRLVATDSLTADQAQDILAAAEDVAGALSLIEPSPSPTPPPSPSPEEEDDDEHGKGKGKGKGHGNDDEGAGGD